MLESALKQPGSPWTCGDGEANDVVLSSRIRLARNFKAHPFPVRQNRESALQVWKILSDFAENTPGYRFYDLSRESALARQVLVEKHLISPEHSRDDDHHRALVLAEDGRSALMVNEEDHLRLQVFAPGLDLDDLWQRANALDDAVEQRAAYAFDPELGYLTSCPTNLGTGLRASVLVHVPALRMTHRLGLLQQLSQMGMVVRGLYGEGSEAKADFYQISNQQTLGQSEGDILQNLQAAAEGIVSVERAARDALRAAQGETLSDQVHRAIGVLAYAQRMSGDEAWALLSLVRMGRAMGLIHWPELAQIDGLILAAQPAFMQLQGGVAWDERERDKHRAAVFREAIQGFDRTDN